MTAWTDGELRRVGDAVELKLASRRDGGELHDAIDRTYHAKYDRFGPGPVSHVTGPAAHPVTIRLVRP